MYGIDISNYQRGIDLSKGSYDFAIIKATEGIGFLDKSFFDFAVQLTKLGKLIGCYHFARPDLNGTVAGMEREANWFIEQVDRAGLIGKAILILDWEKEPFDRGELIKAFCDKVFNLTGITTFIYSNAATLVSWKHLFYDFEMDQPIYMAYWPSIKIVEVGKNPELQKPSYDIPWFIWQYSATGIFPGFKAKVDLDISILTKEEWKSYAQPRNKQYSAYKWAVENGFIEDGTYNNIMTFADFANALYEYTHYIDQLAQTEL